MSELPISECTAKRTPPKRSLADMTSDLQHCFSPDFFLIDSGNGELLSPGEMLLSAPSPLGKELLGRLRDLQEVTILPLGEAFHWLLIPLRAAGLGDACAVALFRQQETIPAADHAAIALQFATAPDGSSEWLGQRPLVADQVLRSWGACLLSKLVAENRVTQLEFQVDQLGQKYQEAHLILDVMEHSQQSAEPRALIRTLLQWAVQNFPAEQAMVVLAEDRCTWDDEQYQDFGNGPFDSGAFRRLLEIVESPADGRPLRLDSQSPQLNAKAFPMVRDLILVALRADGQTVGWMAVVNSASGQFGSHQASLLRAAATVVGARILQRRATNSEDVPQRAYLDKNRVLATVGHEFRTPLNGIIGFTRLLLDGSYEDEEDWRDGLKTIESCAERLTEIADDFATFAQLEMGAYEPQPMPCRLDDVIMGVVSVLQSRANDKGISLTATGSAATLGVFQYDSQRLQQALTILVRNAIKFSEQGSVTIIATLAHSENQGFGESPSALSISVVDSGIGIATDKLQTIFEPWVQADSSSERVHGGVGLGLAICQRIARLLEGELRVTSEVGVGSTFTIRLPLRLLDGVCEENIADSAITGLSGQQSYRELRLPPICGSL
jgi:signal transduction histidine kinase